MVYNPTFFPKFRIESVWTNDENIGNHGYIVLRFYGYIGDIPADILEKNIDKPKIDQNLEKKNIRKTS